MLCKTTPSSRLLLRLIIDIVILIALCCVALIAIPRLLPITRRGFFCSDLTLRYPYKASLINRVHITISVIALPAAVMLVVEMLWAAARVTRKSSTSASASGGSTTTGAAKAMKRPRGSPTSASASSHTVQQFTFVDINVPHFVSECYKIIGVYFFGLLLVLLASRALKAYVGRLRPYFFDVCQPQLLESTGGGWACAPPHTPRQNATTGYIVDYECYELAASAELLTMARQSFPSGYSSVITYAMTFVIFYLQARLSAGLLSALRTLLQFACFILAALVSLERYNTHNNHWTDILAGALLGILSAAFVAFVVSDLFKRMPVKPRRKLVRDDGATRIYGYYGVNRVLRYS